MSHQPGEGREKVRLKVSSSREGMTDGPVPQQAGSAVVASRECVRARAGSDGTWWYYQSCLGTEENREGLSHCGVHKAKVTGHSNEKPHGSRCGPCRVRLFSEGPLCSRGQYLRVLADMPWRRGNGLCDVAAEAVNTHESSFCVDPLWSYYVG